MENERKKLKREGPTRPWQGLNGSNSQEMSVLKSIDYQKELPNLSSIAKIISGFGAVYNSFDSEGMDKIPQNGPAMLVFYHGLVPLDAWYFGLHFYLSRRRMIHGLGDRWLFKVPLLKDLLKQVGSYEANPETALKLLSEGRLIGVSPGGVREAISGTKSNYKLLWGDRVGFAKVALQAKVDIIPVFTENVEELYRAPFAGLSIFKWLYSQTKLSLVPIVGVGALPFPVKIKTWVGDPIRHDPRDTPEMLALKTKEAIESLIGEHQAKHQTIIDALSRRFLVKKPAHF